MFPVSKNPNLNACFLQVKCPMPKGTLGVSCELGQGVTGQTAEYMAVSLILTSKSKNYNFLTYQSPAALLSTVLGVAVHTDHTTCLPACLPLCGAVPFHYLPTLPSPCVTLFPAATLQPLNSYEPPLSCTNSLLTALSLYYALINYTN